MSTHTLKINGHVRSVALAVVSVPILLVAIAALQAQIDALNAPPAQGNEELLLRSGSLVKKLSLGYDSLLADIYWTRAVQYYGTRLQQRSGSFELLAPLLNITATLDPKLLVAYQFGGTFLSEHPPGGAGRADLAVELVKRGIAANPSEWRLYHELGFLYYARLKDYQKASDAFLEGSRNPAAPIWMKIMAAHVAEHGESLETSRFIWAELYDSTKNESVRKTALEHVQTLDAQIALRRLNEISEDYWKKFGRFPASIEQLRDAGLVAGELKDPAGYPYDMGPNGMPQLNPHSPIKIDPDKQRP